MHYITGKTIKLGSVINAAILASLCFAGLGYTQQPLLAPSGETQQEANLVDSVSGGISLTPDTQESRPGSSSTLSPMQQLGRANLLTRIKDMARVQGTANRNLFGYGLVVGLAGTGDQTGTEFTVRSLVNMLTKVGVTVDPDDVRVNNVAAVMVTAKLPSFAQAGSKIDVIVSAIGDCDSLEGGTLLYTPLQSGDGEICATAQGPLSIGGFNIQGGGGGGKIQKNHATTARVPGGALIEKDVAGQFSTAGVIRLTLLEPDFTTAARIAKAIGDHFGMPGLAKASTPNYVEVFLGQLEGIYTDMVALIAELEQISVHTDTRSRVVVNERTGTIVAGAEVRVKKVAISHGSLLVSVQTTPMWGPFSPGGQVEDVMAGEERTKVHMVQEGTTLGELVNALNTLGITSRDMIAILQALKEAGALNVELVIM